VSLKGDTAELKLVLGQSTGFVTEDVVDASELFWQLHALDAAAAFLTFVDNAHIVIILDEF